MKVLVISFSVNGAMGDSMKSVVKDLSQHIELHLLTNENVNVCGPVSICNIRFDRKKPFDFIRLSSLYKIWRYVKSIRYDVVFVWSPHPINLFIYRIIDCSKLVCYVHDYKLHSGVKGLDFVLNNIILKKTYKICRKIVVSCNYIRDEITRLKLFPRDKIEVNYLGLLDNLVFPMENSECDIDVLFFGRIEHYKGLDILIELAKKMTSYNFYIVGKGDICQTFGIEKLPQNCIHLNNYVPDKELAKLIQRSKVVVLPYKNATGTQTVQSVFYYSKPIVATKVGCFPEYVTDGIDGFIVEPDDVEALRNALKLLLDDDNRRIQFGNNGNKKIFSIFNNEKIIEKYLEIFQSLK